jgi:hypothetical protein
MLDIALLVFFGVMSYRISKAVRDEATVLAEFKLTTKLALLVLLFPLGPIVFLFASVLIAFPLAYVAAASCYIPALLTARQQARTLETAGTDRVQKAQTAVSQAFGTSLVGLLYIAVVFAFTFGARFIE